MDERSVGDDRAHDLPSAAADVRTGGIRVRGAGDDVGVEEARRHFGGLDLLSTVAGLLAALGTMVLLGGLAGAAGSIGYQLGEADEGDLSVGALVAGIVVLLVAFFVGGWVAGRVARYDGGRNGLVTALLFVLLAAGLAALGAWLGEKYDVLANLDLPQWFSGDRTGIAAVVSAVVGAVAALAAGWFGGKLGERYHRHADALVARTREGGVGGLVDDRRLIVRRPR
ncbi:MAG TPA: hypothetical protein VGB14_13915 [Acidimicrobiales bacterium]|jgi:hypothetical protein